MTFDDRLGRRVVEHARTYLDGIGERPVRATLSGDELRARLGGSLPAGGDDPVEIIDALAAAGLRGTVAWQGPRYFGFVTGGSLPVATAADWLVAAWDQNAQMFAMSPMAATVEQIAAGWLKELLGLPEHWSAGFVTGAQMANFTGLAAARHRLLEQAGWDVERDGLFGAPPIEVIVGDEAHRTVFTALRMLGLGAGRVVRVEADGQGRMRVDRLEAAVRGGTAPCIVCAQMGNVNTGAADAIADIAPLARRRGAWLHIDAVQEGGTCWAGGTGWHGQAARRISICNWSTNNDDIDRSAEAILTVCADPT